MDAKAFQEARRQEYELTRYNTFQWQEKHVPILVLGLGSIAAVALAKILKRKKKR